MFTWKELPLYYQFVSWAVLDLDYWKNFLPRKKRRRSAVDKRKFVFLFSGLLLQPVKRGILRGLNSHFVKGKNTLH